MSNNKGMAMLIVISLILMLLILGGTVMMISTGHFSTSHHRVARTKAYYATEAAMTHVFWQLRTGQSDAGTLPGDFEVNGIDDEQIDIVIGAVNPRSGKLGHRTDQPVGVSPIEIAVDY